MMSSPRGQWKGDSNCKDHTEIFKLSNEFPPPLQKKRYARYASISNPPETFLEQPSNEDC